MTFTDDDLKRLKEVLNDVQDLHNVVMEAAQMKAFVSRLEDSEERLNAVGGVLNLIHSRYKNDLRQNERAALESAISLIQAWRKAMRK